MPKRTFSTLTLADRVPKKRHGPFRARPWPTKTAALATHQAPHKRRATRAANGARRRNYLKPVDPSFDQSCAGKVSEALPKRAAPTLDPSS